MSMIGGSVVPSIYAGSPTATYPATGTLVYWGSAWIAYVGVPAALAGVLPGAPMILPGSSGLAVALFQSRLAQQLTQLGPAIWPFPTIGSDAAPFSPHAPASLLSLTTAQQAVAGVVGGVASGANADGPAIVSYFQANAVAEISTSTVCGRLPSGTSPGTAIEPPAGTVFLPIA